MTKRLDSIDYLRGLVMVIMALDHARGALSNNFTDIMDLRTTTSAYYLTRWITHFCAPIFVFLAGVGAYLSMSRGKSPAAQARFLVTRGLWMIFLEATVVHAGFWLNFDPHYFFGQVFWAIGCSMIALAIALILRLPPTWIGVLGLLICFTHNAFDGVTGPWWWKVLHVKTRFFLPGGFTFYNAYPILAWIGVLFAGFGFGQVFRLDAPRRRQVLLAAGLACAILFTVIRFTNAYGDDRPWAVFQGDAWRTLLSFVNTEKYPPSLLFLLMTIGPGLLVLLAQNAGGPLVTFGRVPLFFYLLHLPLYHGTAALLAYLKFGHAEFMFVNPTPQGKWVLPDGYGVDLPVVYAIWATGIVVLYFACRWFAGVKSRRRDWWLSYL